MSDYPTSIFSFRDIANLPGITYDANKSTALFAEDIQSVVNEIIGIENTLGLDILDGFDTLADRLLDFLTLDGGNLDGDLTLSSGFFLGIGTDAPEDALHILGSTSGIIVDRVANGTSGPGALYRKARGSIGSLSAVQAGDAVGNVQGRGYDGATFDVVANLRMTVESIASGNIAGLFDFILSDSSGSVVSRAVLDSKSRLGIGTSSFNSASTHVIALKTGSAPTSSLADVLQLYSVDVSAGNATLGLFVERAVVSESVTSDRTLTIFVNGVQYKVLLKA